MAFPAAHRLAASGDRRAVHARFQHCLVACAWRHLEIAGRYTQGFSTVWWLAPGGERLPPGDDFR